MARKAQSSGKAPAPTAPHGKAEHGRFRQRQRTRADLVRVTAEIIKAGGNPSMAEIAQAAGVSRRTVYLHFPTLDQLLIDAQLGLLTDQAVENAIEAADTGGDVEARVAAMVDAIGAIATKTLPMGRALIRLTVARDRASRSAEPTRGHRRVGWIKKALAPAIPMLSGRDFEELLSALAIVVGWEALIVLEDVRGLGMAQAVATMKSTARVILRSYLNDSGAGRADR